MDCRCSKIKTFPLKSISLNEAIVLQFKIVNEITNVFNGHEMLNLGDLGVKQPENQPLFTLKIEKVIAKIFDSESAKLVTGSGTGAIRNALHSVFENSKNRKVLVHKAPIYPTTQTSFDMFNIETVEADFNDLDNLKSVLSKNQDLECALVQISRQKLDDSYDAKEVISVIKQNQKIVVITDDNYAVFKTGYIGTEIGADIATFSTFKINGPEGIGCVVGKSNYIKKISSFNYSGGSQVQGWQAYEVLQGMIVSPVMLAIQAMEIQKIADYLNDGHIKEIENAFIVNAQSKVLIIEFKEKIAEKVLEQAEKLGALPNPVGAESKYEFLPLFYRVSATFRKSIPDATEKMIRINPNKSGMKTVLKILKGALENVFK